MPAGFPGRPIPHPRFIIAQSIAQSKSPEVWKTYTRKDRRSGPYGPGKKRPGRGRQAPDDRILSRPAETDPDPSPTPPESREKDILPRGSVLLRDTVR